MHLGSHSPGLLLRDFFSQNGLVFKQAEERGVDPRFVAGDVYDPRDHRTENAKKFLFKKFGEDKLQWSKVCAIRSERFYVHHGQLTISVFGESNLALASRLAKELKKTLRQECAVELRCDEKVYCDSKRYEGIEIADRKHANAVFWTTAVILLFVLLLGAKLLSGIVPETIPDQLLGMPTWESLAIIYWIIRLLMLFFAGV